MLVTRWILKSLTTRETRSRGAQRVIEKKVKINSKNDLAQLFESGSASRLSTSFSSFHHPSRSVGHASRVPLSACVPNRDEWGRDRNQQQTQCSGGSRGGGRGARASPLFLDQTEAQREDPPPPLTYVMVWIRHCNATCCVSVVSLLCYDLSCGFSPGTLVFPFPQNWTCPISDRWAWLALVRFL